MRPVPNIRHILVPHDFSDTAEQALMYAVALAEKFGARVTVLHAYEAPSYGYPDALVASYEFAAEIERAATIALKGVESRIRRPNIELDTMLRRGTPWVEITAAAKERKADLIVMGTHGRRGVARALLGSVAEKVVRSAPCPVLTVHGSDGEQADAVGARPV
jgi:nucleotide-binding universal stress UspA family protein